jgi:hypothetical protein
VVVRRVLKVVHQLTLSSGPAAFFLHRQDREDEKTTKKKTKTKANNQTRRRLSEITVVPIDPIS